MKRILLVMLALLTMIQISIPQEEFSYSLVKYCVSGGGTCGVAAVVVRGTVDSIYCFAVTQSDPNSDMICTGNGISYYCPNIDGYSSGFSWHCKKIG